LPNRKRTRKMEDTIRFTGGTTKMWGPFSGKRGMSTAINWDSSGAVKRKARKKQPITKENIPQLKRRGNPEK